MKSHQGQQLKAGRSFGLELPLDMYKQFEIKQ